MPAPAPPAGCCDASASGSRDDPRSPPGRTARIGQKYPVVAHYPSGWLRRDTEPGQRRQLQRDKSFSAPKARSRRRIDLAAPELRALERHRALQDADRLAHGAAYEDNDLVFCTHRGRSLGWRNVTREFKKHLEAAG